MYQLHSICRSILFATLYLCFYLCCVCSQWAECELKFGIKDHLRQHLKGDHSYGVCVCVCCVFLLFMCVVDHLSSSAGDNMPVQCKWKGCNHSISEVYNIYFYVRINLKECSLCRFQGMSSIIFYHHHHHESFSIYHYQSIL